MNCRDAQTLLALWVGGDLQDQAELRQLKSHMATCEHCRAHRRSLESSQSVLTHPHESETFTASASLWPMISRQIQQSPKPDLISLSKSWLRNGAPFAAAVAVGLIMLLAAWHNTPPHSNEADPLLRGPGLEYVQGPVMTEEFPGEADRYSSHDESPPEDPKPH